MSDLRELARRSLVEYDQHVSPEYSRLREMLNGGLGRVALESHVAEMRQGAANFELVNEFAKFLPHIGEDGKRWPNWFFSVPNANQATAKLIQSSVLWRHSQYVKDGAYEQYCSYPYYVIGKRREGKKAHLLLLTAQQDSTLPKTRNQRKAIATLVKTELSTKKLKVYQQRVQDLRGEPYAKEQLAAEDFFDYQTAIFRIRAQSPGSIYQTTYKHDRSKNSIFIKHAARLDKLIPQDFLEFDVYGHLIDLATKFEKVAEMNTWLAESKALPARPQHEQLQLFVPY